MVCSKEGSHAGDTQEVDSRRPGDLPSDGRRYVIIGGDLSMSPAPLKRHQHVLRHLTFQLDAEVNLRQTGEVFFSPVDVRFSLSDQVQPDLIFLHSENADLYQDNTVYGAPDIVVEVLSPTSRNYDETAKFRLYETHGVPEYWIVDPEGKTIRVFSLVNGEYRQLEQDAAGCAISHQLEGLAIDPVVLFRDIDA